MLEGDVGKDHPQLVYPGWGCEGELAASFPAEGPADLQEGVREVQAVRSETEKGYFSISEKETFLVSAFQGNLQILLPLSSNQGALSHHSETPCFAGPTFFIKE